MPNEMSEMRKNIFKLIAKLGDMTVNGQEVESYGKLTVELHFLSETIDKLYTPNEDGKYPVLTDEDLDNLKKTYKKVMNAGYVAMNGGNEQLSGIAAEITQFAEKDMAALEMADTKKAMSLPEVVSAGRTAAVDIGKQKISVASGQMSARIPINIENVDGTVKSGFFTQTTYVDTKKGVEKVTDKMLRKYPDYKVVIDAIKTLDEKAFDRIQFMTFRDASNSVDQDAGFDEFREEAKTSYIEDELQRLNLTNEQIEGLTSRDDFFVFMDELGNEMAPVMKTRFCYTNSNYWLGLKEGANIDKRNAAMSTVSSLLGKPGLVAYAEPIIVMIDGKPVSGTFMEKVNGVEPYHIQEKDEEVKDYDEQNYNNPDVFDDIAAIQAIDFICGNADRHPGNFFMNFDHETKKLVGIKAIDNDLSFGIQVPGRNDGSLGNKWVAPSQMGAIGEQTAMAIMAMTEDMLAFTLSGYGLAPEEISAAWQRTVTLQQEIIRGLEFYADKEVGVLEERYLRVVPQNEWGAYNIEQLAEVGDNQFKTFAVMSQKIEENDISKEREQEIQNNINQILGIIPEEPEEAPVNAPVVAKPVGNGLQQVNLDIDRMGVKSPDTIKVVLDYEAHLRSVGGSLSSRHPVAFEENGIGRKGFFTAARTLDMQNQLNRLIDDAIIANEEYEEELELVRRYYLRDVEGMYDVVIFRPEEFPYEDLGLSKQKANELRNDDEFSRIFSAIHNNYRKAYGTVSQYEAVFEAHHGSTIERRNVAMSKMGNMLGVPDILANSKTMQLQIGNRIVDGVYMEAANGVDLNRLTPEDKVVSYPPETYNSGPGLKCLAELQVLDYICLNADRHTRNMVYQFSNDENPKFLGVVGIDNDFSFGSKNPKRQFNVSWDTPLEVIDKISERMSEKILNTTPEDLEQTLKDQGISREEIYAAQSRLASIQAGIENGKIKVLTDEQWDKLTLQELAVKGSIFKNVYDDLVVNIGNLAHTLQEHPEKFNTDEIIYAKANKVDDFDANVNKAYNEEKAVRTLDDNFQKEMQELVKKFKDVNAKTDAELFHETYSGVKAIYEIIDDADPALMLSSAQYRDMKKEAKELKALTESVEKQVQKGNNPTAQQTEDMVRRLSRLNTRIAEYLDYKLDSVNGDETSFNNTELKRVTAARTSNSIANSLMASYRANEPLRRIEINALRTIHQGIAAIQNEIDIPGKSPEEVNTMLATIIYYKVLSCSDKKLGKKITTALSTEAKEEAVNQIKNSAGFKELLRNPDRDIITLACEGNGDTLYKSYLRMMAAEANKEKAPVEHNPNKDQLMQPQANFQGIH